MTTMDALDAERTTRVGFIGLGVMGLPMALNILAAGFPVHVYARSAAKARDIDRRGATVVPTCRALAAASDVVIVMVPATADLETVVEGPNGLAAGAHGGLIVVAMGTHEPWAMPAIAERLAPRGAAFLDAPVSGGESAAIAGTLAIMVGGDPAVFERARPVLESMGRRVVRIGPVGTGQVAKACNQLIVGSTIEAVAEALTLAGALGADPAIVREVMLGGFAASRVLELHGQRMLDRDFTPGGRVALHAKDAHIVLEAAARAGVQVPGFVPVAAAFDTMVERGSGDLDHSALIELLTPPD
jgi:2-hydroxy-3-oxopropionate reductase